MLRAPEWRTLMAKSEPARSGDRRPTKRREAPRPPARPAVPDAAGQRFDTEYDPDPALPQTTPKPGDG